MLDEIGYYEKRKRKRKKNNYAAQQTELSFIRPTRKHKKEMKKDVEIKRKTTRGRNFYEILEAKDFE